MDHDPLMEAAAEWLMREIDGLDASSLAARDAWLAASPDHAAAFARIRSGWDAAGLLVETPVVQEARHTALSSQRRARWPVAVAACFALAMVGAAAWRTLDGSAPSIERTVLETRLGEQANATLSDGSQITLDTDSRVETAFDAGHRNLVLVRGQAFFNVAHDRSRPFIVRAGEREVVAVGTRFDVFTEATRITVALTQGRVRVEPAGTASKPALQNEGTELGEGQTLVFQRTSGQTLITRDDQVAQTDWQQGRLHFNETPLGDAVARFNRYGSRRLVLDDPTLAAMPISGVFEARNGPAFAQALAALFPVTVETRSNAIVVRRIEKSPDR